MTSRLSRASSHHSGYPASESGGTRSATSVSQRSSRTSAPLSHLASRLSTAGQSYRAQTYRADRPAPSGQSYAYQPSAYSAAAHSEYGSIAESTYETATSRPLSDSSSDLFEVDINRSARRSAADSDLFEIDHRAGRPTVAGSARASSVAEGLSQAGTASERSFHLSERSDVDAALHNGRLGYTSDSSRRLTSELSSMPPNSDAGSLPSMTPSELSALRAAQALGRFARADLADSDLDSDYGTYLVEGDDLVAPLRSDFRQILGQATANDPDSIVSASTSRRLSDRTPSMSGRLGDTYRPTVDGGWSIGDSSGRLSQFGGADVESLSAAGARPSTSRPGHMTMADYLREPL